MKRKIIQNILLLIFVVAPFLVAFPQSASAATQACANGEIVDVTSIPQEDRASICNNKGGTLAQKSACERSGGTWVSDQDRGNTVNSCTACKDGKVSNGATCTADSNTDGDSGSSNTADGTGTDYTTDTNIQQPDTSAKDCNDKSGQLNRDNCGIVKYLAIFINVLSGVVGVVVTGVIVWGGIEYATSGGDPGKVQAAKKKIYNGIFSLVAFIFTYAFLQYIVPGGVL
jgi:hypothetical protein